MRLDCQAMKGLACHTLEPGYCPKGGGKPLEGLMGRNRVQIWSGMMEDARVFKTTINLATVENMLEAGVQYIIKLQIGQDKVTLGEITASPWGYAAGGVLETE